LSNMSNRIYICTKKILVLCFLI